MARVLSLLSPSVVARLGGIPLRAVAGKLEGDTFAENEAFVAVLQGVIRHHTPRLPGFADAARKRGTGSIVMVDLRTPDPDGEVPPEDIFGAFAITDGHASSETYAPNPAYRVYTRHGLLRLPDGLAEILLAELERDG